MNSEDQKKKGIGYFFDFSEVLNYYFRKKDPNKRPNVNLRMMHGINKIAILMFLFGFFYMVYKFLFVY